MIQLQKIPGKTAQGKELNSKKVIAVMIYKELHKSSKFVGIYRLFLSYIYFTKLGL